MASQDWFEKDFYKILGIAKDAPEAEASSEDVVDAEVVDEEPAAEKK